MKLSLSQLPSAPYSLFKCREDPAYPQLSWAGGAHTQRNFGRSRNPKVPLEAAVSSWLPARGCRLQGEGVGNSHCSAATVTFSYAALQQECTPWPCSCFHTLLGYLQHHIHTHDTEFTHTARPYCTRASEFPSSSTAAPHPGSTATRCAHQGMLHGCDNQTCWGQIASNLNLRDEQKNLLSLHLKELVFSDITVIKLQYKPY